MNQGLGWIGIVRLGLVQSAIGAMVVLCTSTLNRVMVVEMHLAASIPAALVAWHYVLQLSRPLWGYGSDRGGRRTTWIVAGMALLAMGALLAANAAIISGTNLPLGTVLGVGAYTLIGAGVGAAGTSLLALLATEVTPDRRPAAAAITWIMMIAGIVVTAIASGAVLDPYSPQRLALVASGVTGIAFVVSGLAVWGVEKRRLGPPKPERQVPFARAFAEVWNRPLSRRFTIFVFVSMLAYSAQDLILEPYAGLIFGFSLGQSTQLSGTQHSGVLLGMALAGGTGFFVRTDKAAYLRLATIAGCLLSAASLVMLGLAGHAGPAWPLSPTVFALGFANGVFAVSAIGLMMAYAGTGEAAGEGTHMGVWGAAQGIAFGAGGFAGASSLDAMRHLMPDAQAFLAVFGAEALLFLAAAWLALRLAAPERKPEARPVMAEAGGLS
jgi:BCD family chlorophyll transporter-like MFS transporter